jgi:hypothetical protein
MLSPRAEALAFRVWQFAEPLGWDCTTTEVADAIRSTPAAVRRVGYLKGWTARFRRTADWQGTDPGHRAPACSEAMLDGEGHRAAVARYARLADEAPE